MFERFTDRARRVVVLAQEAARDMEHCRIDPGHILLGLIEEGEGLAWRALTNILGDDGVNALQVKTIESLRDVPTVTIPPPHIPFTPSSKKVLELSLREGLQLGHNYIGTEHLLLAIMRQDGRAAECIKRESVDLNQLRQVVIGILSGRRYAQEESKEEPKTQVKEVIDSISAVMEKLWETSQILSELAGKLR